METYGGTCDERVLVLLQLAKNGFFAGANGDILGVNNPAQIVADKSTVAEIMREAIFLDGVNVQKYKQLKDDLEKYFYKGIDN